MDRHPQCLYRVSRIIIAVGGLFCFTGLLAASAASVTYYAAPDGSGSLCSVQRPCSLYTAQLMAQSVLRTHASIDVMLEDGI